MNNLLLAFLLFATQFIINLQGADNEEISSAIQVACFPLGEENDRIFTKEHDKITGLPVDFLEKQITKIAAAQLKLHEWKILNQIPPNQISQSVIQENCKNAESCVQQCIAQQEPVKDELEKIKPSIQFLKQRTTICRLLDENTENLNNFNATFFKFSSFYGIATLGLAAYAWYKSRSEGTFFDKNTIYLISSWVTIGLFSRAVYNAGVKEKRKNINAIKEKLEKNNALTANHTLEGLYTIQQTLAQNDDKLWRQYLAMEEISHELGNINRTLYPSDS